MGLGIEIWGECGNCCYSQLLTKVAELEEVGTTPSMVYPMLPPRVKLARTKSVPSVANAVEEDDDDDDSEEPDSTAGKASSRTTSQILFAGLCTLAVSFQAGGLQFELRLRSGGDMSAGLELTVFMHMPEHTEIRKGRYGVIAAGISGLGTTVLHSQPWPFLVQMRVSLVSAQDDGRQLFSFKHCATFTDDNCRFSVPSFVPIEAIEAAAADIFDHKLPFHGDNGLRIEVCMQVGSAHPHAPSPRSAVAMFSLADKSRDPLGARYTPGKLIARRSMTREPHAPCADATGGGCERLSGSRTPSTACCSTMWRATSTRLSTRLALLLCTSRSKTPGGCPCASSTL